MKLEMKFTERDKKLVVFLTLFLLIVGGGYFGIRPLYTKVQELGTQAEELEMQAEQTKSHIASLPQIRTTNEQLQNDRQQELKDFYPYMESQELDKMITELTLQASLGAKNLTITIPEESYTITPYFLTVSQKDEGEQLTESEQAYEDETTDDAQTFDTSESDGAERILYAAQLSVDATGTHAQLQKYIDLLSDDEKYPALQVNSYSWGTDTWVGTDELGALLMQSSEQLHIELSVYMQGKEED